MTDVLVLTAEQAAKIWWKDQFSHSVLRPIGLSDGRYFLPLSVKTAPEHARWRGILNQATIEDLSTLTPGTYSLDQLCLTAGSGNVPMGLYNGQNDPSFYRYPAPSMIDVPVPGLWRFESRYSNDLSSPGRSNNRRRTELIQQVPDGYQSGDVVWAAWSTIISDKRGGFDQSATTMIHQWHQHPTSIYGPPPFALVIGGGSLTFNNRSANSSTNTVLYSMATPASGAVTNFVLQGTLGVSGHWNIWVNGVQVVNVDTNIGYTSEALPYLARVTTGIYMDNVRSIDALYHANVEFGLTSLSARIATPLTVTTPPGGWV